VSKWILTKTELPKESSLVFIAILNKPINYPQSYSVMMALYKKENWHDLNTTHSFFTPEYWQPLPAAPKIEYQNKPDECSHEWREDSNSRYCHQCGSYQKEIKEERIRRWK